MAKWEYATVNWFWDDGPKTDNIQIFFPNNGLKKIPGNNNIDRDNQILMETLNDLGRDGWEVVSSASGEKGGWWVYWTLKRELK